MTTIDRFVTHHIDGAGADGTGVHGLPRGPRLPKFVQTTLFLTMGTYVTPFWRRRYGEVFAVHIAPAGRAVILSNPEHIKEVFAGAADTFHAGEGNAILGPIMGEHSVLLLDEDAHRVSRKKVMSAFRGSAVSSWGAVVERLAADDVATWPVGRAFAVHQHMNDISLEVILRIVFGVTDDRRLDEMRPLLQRLVRVGPTIFLGWMYPKLEAVGPWKSFAALKARVDDLIYAEIADRRGVPDLDTRTDVLSKLLVADPAQSDAELRDHLVTLLLAGHETTATTLAWTWHDLTRNPAVLARVQQAADDDDESYLEATIKESMRLRPVIANVARRLTEPVTVAGYDLPAGVVVFPSIDLVHHDETIWDAPHEFRPERFLGRNPPPATWIPFGGGLRRCLGSALAMVEAVAVLKTVLKTVDVSAAGPPELSKKRNITTVPARGARIVSRPR